MITDAHVTLLAIGSIFFAIGLYGLWLLRLHQSTGR
jgi:hypothetical protein